MALIWAEGFTDEKALAPLWRRHIVAKARWQDRSLPQSERIVAGDEADDALAAYKRTVDEAKAALVATARRGESRTHALVVGVGRYKAANIRTLTTSVLGAWAFTDWILTRFYHPERPLGSVELILSPGGGQGDWQPSPNTAAKLGLTDGSTTATLPVEQATYDNIKAAFMSWLEHAGTNTDNAAFFYFSGHGLWKGEPYLLPEDAQIANSTDRSFDNLIDIQRTQLYMFNWKPRVQCFFIDACQEVISELLETPSSEPPGKPLLTPTTGAVIPRRDSWRYEGARPSRRAFGPADDAPFFTQELLACLERRGAEPVKLGNSWRVTTASLKQALEAASEWRKEADEKAKEITFSTAPGQSEETATLCKIQGSPEVFVKVECVPANTMDRARLFVESSGVRSPRPRPLPNPWVMKVTQGDCVVGADFESSAALESAPESFEARPPVYPVQLTVKPRT